MPLFVRQLRGRGSAVRKRSPPLILDPIEATYDPQDRYFVFKALEGHLVRRTPARGLTVEDLTGLEKKPDVLPPQQWAVALTPRKVAYHLKRSRG